MRRRTMFAMPARRRGPRGGYNFAVMAYGSSVSALPIEKFFFDTCTSVYSQTLANDQTRDGPSSFGNFSQGYFAGGYTGSPTTQVTRYSFGADTIVLASTMANGTGRYSAGFGHLNVGYSTLNGFSGKYTFANDVTASATTLGYSAQLLAAISGQDYGVVAGGYSSLSNTDRYRYSNDTRAAATALGAGRYGLSGMSGPIFGVFVCGYNLSIFPTGTDEYNHATGTRTSGTAIDSTDQPQGGGGVADVHAGRQCGGGVSTSGTVQVYHWSTSSVTFGSNRLSFARRYAGHVSGCAPHLSTIAPV